jgi:hypothetical protein
VREAVEVGDQRSDGFNDEADGGQHEGDCFAQGQEDQPDEDQPEIVEVRGPTGAPEGGSDDGKQSSNGEGHGGPEETIHRASIHEFAVPASVRVADVRITLADMLAGTGSGPLWKAEPESPRRSGGQ